MPVYEFECPKGHKFSELVRVGTQNALCMQCGRSAKDSDPVVFAERVLSPTRTTFKYADTTSKI